MAPDKIINEWDKSQSQVRLHHAMNAGLLGILFFGALLLGFVVVCSTAKITPPEVKQPHEIGSSYANKDCLLDMAGYILGMVLIVVPEMIDYNSKVILKMADLDGRIGLKTTLDAAAIWSKQERVVTIWVPCEEEVNEQDKHMKVSGKLKAFIVSKFTSEREKDYLIEFTITTLGHLYVSKIGEIVKRDPPANEPAGS